jgi:hypothetical protein
MQLQVKTHGCHLLPGEKLEVLRHVEQIRPELARFDPDLVRLELVLEKHARRMEYLANLRLLIMQHVLVAHRNTARDIRTVLNQAFDDVREQLASMQAQLRHSPSWQRKRGLRSEELLDRTERQLVELRAAFDEALAADRVSFAVLADTRLPAVRRAIYEIMTQDGKDADAEDLDRALMYTLATAHQDLKSKPDGWSLQGWLAWVARRELCRSIHSSAQAH